MAMEEPDTGRYATTRRYRQVAGRVLDGLLETAPAAATALGDHRFDDRLDDLSAEGVAARTDLLQDALAALDGVDDVPLDVPDQVDLEILRTAVAADLWRLEELREHEHDPLAHLPGPALAPLVAPGPGEPAARAAALAARLGAVPQRLEVARAQLQGMPRVHVEAALEQTHRVVALLGAPVDALLERAPAARPAVDAVRVHAAAALEEYGRWLQARLPECDADPRLGEQRFAARLWYALDTETSPDVLLTRAESDLQAVEEEIAEVAARLAGAPPRAGQVREVLDRLTAGAALDAADVVPLCRETLAAVTARVRELDLVTLPAADEAVEVVETAGPAGTRGTNGTDGRAVGALVTCRAPGPLEEPRWPAVLGVTPPGPGGPPASRHALRARVVHEGVPGRALQLWHAQRHTGSTPVRAALRSATFTEGWVAHAGHVVTAAGLGRDDDALRLHRLAGVLRTTIAAVVDVRVHAHGMSEAEAVRLLTGRGHVQPGAAAGTWRRALIAPTRLSARYLGHHEVRDVVTRLRAATPGITDRQLHDTVLAHGAPPPRHLRALLDL